MRISDWSSDVCSSDLPTFAFQTPPNSGVDVYYDNMQGYYPSITTNVDLNDPNLGWQWYRQNIALVRRKTETKGAHLDVMLGDAAFNVKVGAAYDRATRSIRAYDNRSEEHTSELQSLMRISYAVFCLKKKNKHDIQTTI